MKVHVLHNYYRHDFYDSLVTWWMALHTFPKLPIWVRSKVSFHWSSRWFGGYRGDCCMYVRNLHLTHSLWCIDELHGAVPCLCLDPLYCPAGRGWRPGQDSAEWIGGPQAFTRLLCIYHHHDWTETNSKRNLLAILKPAWQPAVHRSLAFYLVNRSLPGQILTALKLGLEIGGVARLFFSSPSFV